MLPIHIMSLCHSFLNYPIYPVLSYTILSCPISYPVYSPVLSYHILSYHYVIYICTFSQERNQTRFRSFGFRECSIDLAYFLAYFYDITTRTENTKERPCIFLTSEELDFPWISI